MVNASLLLVPLLSLWAALSSGRARGKSNMFRIFKFDVACEHLAHRRITYRMSTRVREVGQRVTKKESSFRSGGKQTFELFAP